MNFTIKAFLLAIFIVLSSQSFCQTRFETTRKRFGILVGTNLSNMNFNGGFPAPAVPIKASWKSGLVFGFLIRIPVAKNLYLQPEYCYTQRGGSNKSTGMNYRADYLSLPVLLSYNFSPRFALLAGPQPELLIHAKTFDNQVSNTITHDIEERNISLTVGFDFCLHKSLSVSGRYLQGLNHIGVGQRSDVKEFKYQAVSLSIEVAF